jgi:eukaryotic-like serine/threonine-protein kinase
MHCGTCQFENVPGANRCARCGSPLNSDVTVTSAAVDPSPTITQLPATFASSSPGGNVLLSEVRPGTVIGERYEILRLLGEGGMGVVYGARDREVDRQVALKVIRPEFSNRPEILNRFKHELILARQITHRNVIRIFDFGQADGIKFITMELVEGTDLRSLLRRGDSIALNEKVKIVIQICLALEAAHEEGVVHRDLKPQNVVVENSGRVVVMDFGIARSMEDVGITSTGALVGTPAYMSPEQAKGEKIDTRSDLFSLGIVFYELLTGEAPYVAETAMGLLLKRVQERPIPPADRNRETPQVLSDVVLRCLAVDRDERYQSAREIVQDLEAWVGSPGTSRTVMNTRAASGRLGKSPQGRTIVTPAMMMMADASTWKWIAVSLGALVLVIAGVFAALRWVSKPAVPHAPVTVMVADFSNHTGDPIFDGTLESTFKLGLEGASFINAYSRANPPARIPAGTLRLDEQTATRLAVSQGIGVVVSGSLDRQGAGYGLSVKAVQAVTGAPIKNAEGTAANKDQVLFTVAKLASAIRTGLGDDTSESAQRFATETLSTASLEAVHEYSQGMVANSDGNFDEARRSFSKAADLDPTFGLAYVARAGMDRNLGQVQDAQKYIKLAVNNIDHMTERERYRTRGVYYVIMQDHQKCADEYRELIKRYSADAGAHNNLAYCYTQLRKMPEAVQEMRKVVGILPNRATWRNNLALYLSYGGDFQNGEREARAAQQLNPYDVTFISLAFAQLGQDQVDQASETYRKLEKSPSYFAAALGDLAFYEGRFSDAVRILEKGAGDDVTAKNLDVAGAKLAELAYVQLVRGQKGAAVSAAERALKNSQLVKIRFLAGRAFAEAGETGKARQWAATLASEDQTEPQAYAKLIEGEVALQDKDAASAVKAFTEANNLLDTWIGHFDLGRAYLEAGRAIDADSEFDHCIKRRGEALALFLDEIPTYGYFPPVYFYQGRALEAMNTADKGKEYYRKYIAIRGKAGEDPLLAEAQRKVGR